MMTVAIYIIKAIACSGILYLYYGAALRNKLFHQWNRFFLLASVVLSLSLPLITIPVVPPTKGSDAILQLATAVSYNEEAVIASGRESAYYPHLESVLSVCYSAVSVLFFLISITALYRIWRIIRKMPKVTVGTAYFINSDAKGTPFSFFNYIIWNRQIDIHTEAGQQIWKHELAHVEERHTLDKIFLNFVLILFWINPFFWLIRNELYTIHEFVADRKAVETHGEAALVQMILTTVYPDQHYLFTSHFFQSLIKRRLYMFAKLQNPKYSYAGRVLALPLFVLLVSAFTLKNKKAVIATPELFIPENTVLVSGDTNAVESKSIAYADVPNYKGLIVVNNNVYKGLWKNFPIKETGIKRIAFMEGQPLIKQFGSGAKDGVINIETEDDKGRKVDIAAPLFSKGEVRLQVNKLNRDTVIQPAKSHNVNDTNSISVKRITWAKAEEINGWTVINDNTVPVRFTKLTISSDSIEYIQFMEGKALLKLYGEKAKDGLIAITTKEQAKKWDQQREQSGGPPFTQVEVEPAFAGGSNAWQVFLQQNLNAGVPASNKAPAGTYTAVVQFIVNRDGSISDIQPQTKHGYGMEEELVRVMKLSPKWVPATQNGHTVKAYKKQPLTFVVTDEQKSGRNTNTSGTHKMNVFYIGIDNPFTIFAADFKPEDLVVTISNGSVVRKGNRFIVLVSKAGDVVISVSRWKEGELKEVGKFNFKGEVLTEERARELGAIITHSS